jgi:energy-coupling factor transport system permease protein
MLFTAAVWAVLFAFNNLFAILGVLLMLHLLFAAAEIPRERLKAIWKAFLPIGIFIPLIWAFFYPVGSPTYGIGPLTFSPFGLILGLILALRLISLAFALFLWLYTTDPNSLVLGLVKLRMPYEWGLVFALVLQFIPAFQNLYRSIFEAQQARGLRIEGSGFHRVRLMMPILVAMVISVLRHSDQLTRALESRAFGVKGIRRTFLRELQAGPFDYLYAAAILAVTLFLLVLNLGFHIGEQPLYPLG